METGHPLDFDFVGEDILEKRILPKCYSRESLRPLLCLFTLKGKIYYYYYLKSVFKICFLWDTVFFNQECSPCLLTVTSHNTYFLISSLTDLLPYHVAFVIETTI